MLKDPKIVEECIRRDVEKLKQAREEMIAQKYGLMVQINNAHQQLQQTEQQITQLSQGIQEWEDLLGDDPVPADKQG